jgi:hypothetical protein
MTLLTFLPLFAVDNPEQFRMKPLQRTRSPPGLPILLNSGFGALSRALDNAPLLNETPEPAAA